MEGFKSASLTNLGGHLIKVTLNEDVLIPAYGSAQLLARNHTDVHYGGLDVVSNINQSEEDQWMVPTGELQLSRYLSSKFYTLHFSYRN